jgi:hypothetical protein
MRSNNSKNSAVSSSSVLEDCWGKGIVSSIGRGPPFAQVRAVCPSPPQLLHLLGDRFFGGSDSAIIISNSDSALRMVSAGAHAFYWRFWRPVSASKNSVPGGQVLRTKSYRTRVLSLGPPQFGILGRRCKLFRIESERLKLSAPFSGWIAEPLDTDGAGQATFH